ncbi:hypothetical protein, partial [Salmonella sp. s51090]|uniref:hypothetical protein n=1 Tax=Salmonella sp. s51090 TaxID=3159651 RepID=UPI00397F2C19
LIHLRRPFRCSGLLRCLNFGWQLETIFTILHTAYFPFIIHVQLGPALKIICFEVHEVFQGVYST